MCFLRIRSFIYPFIKQEVFRVNRDFKCCAGWSCCAGCCDGCAHEVMVTEPDGKILGYVKQKYLIFKNNRYLENRFVK